MLEDTIIGISRNSFGPYRPFDVTFLGEKGEDGGGPRREFWRLLAHGIRNSMCVGSGEALVLKHDVTGIHTKKFEMIGQLMAMVLAQDGSGFPFLAPCVYEYLCGMDLSCIKIDPDEVPDYELKLADNVNDMRKTLFDNADIIMNSGYTKPLMSAELFNVNEIVDTVSLQSTTLLQSIAEMEQLKRGLNVLGVTHFMRDYPLLLTSFFTSPGNNQLSADQLQGMFQTIRFSDKGTNDRILEEETYMMMFVKIMNECEG